MLSGVWDIFNVKLDRNKSTSNHCHHPFSWFRAKMPHKLTEIRSPSSAFPWIECRPAALATRSKAKIWPLRWHKRHTVEEPWVFEMGVSLLKAGFEGMRNLEDSVTKMALRCMLALVSILHCSDLRYLENVWRRGKGLPHTVTASVP